MKTLNRPIIDTLGGVIAGVRPKASFGRTWMRSTFT
jgi:hypothetical protein